MWESSRVWYKKKASVSWIRKFCIQSQANHSCGLNRSWTTIQSPLCLKDLVTQDQHWPRVLHHCVYVCVRPWPCSSLSPGWWSSTAPPAASVAQSPVWGLNPAWSDSPCSQTGERWSTQTTTHRDYGQLKEAYKTKIIKVKMRFEAWTAPRDQIIKPCVTVLGALLTPGFLGFNPIKLSSTF